MAAELLTLKFTTCPSLPHPILIKIRSENNAQTDIYDTRSLHNRDNEIDISNVIISLAEMIVNAKKNPQQYVVKHLMTHILSNSCPRCT